MSLGPAPIAAGPTNLAEHATVFGYPAEDITAVFTLILAIATVALVTVGYVQLRLLIAQIREAGRLQLEANTIRACERYVSDSVIFEATKRIWNESKGGKEYALKPVGGTSGIDEHDLTAVLNYLDGIAVGVKQKVFSEEIVRDHLGSSYIKMVDVVIPATLKDFKYYEAILELRNRWQPEVVVAYKPYR